MAKWNWFTTKAAVDLDKALQVLDKGTSGYDWHFLIDLMDGHSQPTLLTGFGLKPRVQENHQKCPYNTIVMLITWVYV